MWTFTCFCRHCSRRWLKHTCTRLVSRAWSGVYWWNVLSHVIRICADFEFVRCSWASRKVVSCWISRFFRWMGKERAFSSGIKYARSIAGMVCGGVRQRRVESCVSSSFWLRLFWTSSWCRKEHRCFHIECVKLITFSISVVAHASADRDLVRGLDW